MWLIVYWFFGVVVIVFIVGVLFDVDGIFFFLVVLLDVGFIFVVVWFNVVL